MENPDPIRRLLEARSDVRLAYVFGSLARGEARPTSDADIAILFAGSPAPDSLDRLVADLEAAAGRGVDLVVLNDAPPLLAHEVVSTGTCLVRGDEDERVGFVARTVSRYVDTAHLRSVQHAYLRERTEARRAPVRAEIVRRKLLDIGQAVGRLRSWLPVTVDRLEQDSMLQWAVSHGLHIAAEALFDAGSHILAGEFQEAVDEYREIPIRLLARDVIARETAKRLESLAGFRNVLVDEYADIDLRRLHAGLARLDDLEAFVADVESWLLRKKGPR